jgi:O-antigen/teichoic acid export membrane protein
VLGRYVSFHVTILRADQRFAVTSKLSILEAALTLVSCGLATWLWGLPGLYAGTLVVMLGSMWFVRRHAAATLGWAFDRAEIRRLIAIGAPILLAGAGSSLFRSLDKLMILAYMGDCEFQLGCYSTALLVTAQLYGLANMLATVTGPRYGEMYGHSGSRRKVARLAARCSELQAAAMVLPASLALLVAAPLLGWLLPDYSSGLASLVWLIPGVLALVLALPCGQYMVAVGRQRRALLAVLIATGIGAAGNHVALSNGWGLSGVAAATAVGYASYFVLAAGMSFLTDLDTAGRARYVLMHALALIPTLTSALLLRGWTTLPVAIFGVLLVWSATMLIGWRYGRWQTQGAGE